MFRLNASSCSTTSASVAASRFAVASSRIRIGASFRTARAIATRCSPPLQLQGRRRRRACRARGEEQERPGARPVRTRRGSLVVGVTVRYEQVVAKRSVEQVDVLRRHHPDQRTHVVGSEPPDVYAVEQHLSRHRVPESQQQPDDRRLPRPARAREADTVTRSSARLTSSSTSGDRSSYQEPNVPELEARMHRRCEGFVRFGHRGRRVHDLERPCGGRATEEARPRGTRRRAAEPPRRPRRPRAAANRTPLDPPVAHPGIASASTTSPAAPARIEPAPAPAAGRESVSRSRPSPATTRPSPSRSPPARALQSRSARPDRSLANPA